jgi:hypothetical protein
MLEDDEEFDYEPPLWLTIAVAAVVLLLIGLGHLWYKGYL